MLLYDNVCNDVTRTGMPMIWMRRFGTCSFAECIQNIFNYLKACKFTTNLLNFGYVFSKYFRPVMSSRVERKLGQYTRVINRLNFIVSNTPIKFHSAKNSPQERKVFRLSTVKSAQGFKPVHIYVISDAAIIISFYRQHDLIASVLVLTSSRI